MTWSWSTVGARRMVQRLLRAGSRTATSGTSARETRELNRHGKMISREGSFKAGRTAPPRAGTSRAHPSVGTGPVRSSTRATPRTTSESVDRHAHVSVPFVTTRPRRADQGMDAARARRARQQVLRPRRRRPCPRSRSRARRSGSSWSPSTAGDRPRRAERDWPRRPFQPLATTHERLPTTIHITNPAFRFAGQPAPRSAEGRVGGVDTRPPAE